MLNVTTQARNELHGMLVRALAQHPQAEDPTLGFRLVPGAGGEASRLGLTLDSPREGDEILEHEGHSVLIVDASTAEVLNELTLDVVETPEGNRLGIRE